MYVLNGPYTCVIHDCLYTNGLYTCVIHDCVYTCNPHLKDFVLFDMSKNTKNTTCLPNFAITFGILVCVQAYIGTFTRQPTPDYIEFE